MSFDTRDTNVGTLDRGLMPLSDLRDYDVAAGYPDIRGWDVKAGNDKIGEVKDLLVDTAALEARYVVIGLKHGLFSKERRVVVPIGRARLDDDSHDLYLDDIDASRLDTLNEYDADTFMSKEQSLFSGDYTQPDYARDRFWGRWATRGDTTNARFIVRRQEQVNVGTRQVSAGEVVVTKSVETERVMKNVPLTHEEVTIERRPIAAGTDAGVNAGLNAGVNAEFRGEEVRIPLMAEEAVVEKRVVPVEEVIVKKTLVEENRPVEVDVRKERIDVDAPPGVKKPEKV